MRAARKLGAEFQSGVNEIVREAELEDAKRELQKLSAGFDQPEDRKGDRSHGDLKKAINAPVEETKAALSAPATSGPAAVTPKSLAAALPVFPPSADIACPAGRPTCQPVGRTSMPRRPRQCR